MEKLYWLIFATLKSCLPVAFSVCRQMIAAKSKMDDGKGEKVWELEKEGVYAIKGCALRPPGAEQAAWMKATQTNSKPLAPANAGEALSRTFPLTNWTYLASLVAAPVFSRPSFPSDSGFRSSFVLP